MSATAACCSSSCRQRGRAHPGQLRHRAVCHRISPSGSASPRIDNHAGIVRPGGGGQASPEVDADLVVPVGENLGDQVTEAHRLTPPHTSGLGSWLSTSGCGSATRKADAALPRSGRGPIHVPGWRVDGNWLARSPRTGHLHCALADTSATRPARHSLTGACRRAATSLSPHGVLSPRIAVQPTRTGDHDVRVRFTRH